MFLYILGFVMCTMYLNYCGPLWVYVVLWSYLRTGNTFHDLSFRKISHIFSMFHVTCFQWCGPCFSSLRFVG